MEYSISARITLSRYYVAQQCRTSVGLKASRHSLYHSCFLGPKLYSSTKDVAGVGSTKLHLDVSSAVNILVHTSGEGLAGARWHIFLAADTEKLRAYLRSKTVCGDEQDPIHAQETYVTPAMLAELRQLGVISFEFQQKLHDTVFIPAGCAHQVSSMDLCNVALADARDTFRSATPLHVSRSRATSCALKESSQAHRSLRSCV